MRWVYDVFVGEGKAQRHFQVNAKDEREALERCEHALRGVDLVRTPVVFQRGALAPRQTW